jgi:hypothetical protein
VESGLEITQTVKLLSTGRVRGSFPDTARLEPFFVQSLLRGLISGG